MRRNRHNTHSKSFLRRLLRGCSYCFAALIIFLAYSYFETYWLKVNHVVIESPDIPPAFNGKKIVFLSDIHYGGYMPKQQLNRVIKLINEQHPDMILLGGDYCFKGSSYIRPVFEALEKAKAPLGKYAVLGNYDNFMNTHLTLEMMKKTGIHICDNKSYWLKLDGDSIKIGGVGELAREKQLLDSTTYDVKPSDFCILMCHQPAYVETLKSNKVDLTLSGHTHGGQITLFGLWAPVLPKIDGGRIWFPSSTDERYRYGLVKKGKMQSYITSGVGTGSPHLRFFCRPEIAVLTLKRVEK